MNKIVLDTNILIYALDQSSTFHQRASSILQDSNNALFIPSKVLAEYFAVCSKLGIDQSKVIGFYTDLQRNATFLFPTATSLDHFLRLLEQYQPKGNRVFDLEIVSVMLANDLQVIATFNVSDFQPIEEVRLLE